MPFAAPTRSPGRRRIDAGAGSAATADMDARRASRALLRSAWLLFTLMDRPSRMPLVKRAMKLTDTASRSKELLAARALTSFEHLDYARRGAFTRGNLNSIDLRSQVLLLILYSAR